MNHKILLGITKSIWWVFAVLSCLFFLSPLFFSSIPADFFFRWGRMFFVSLLLLSAAKASAELYNGKDCRKGLLLSVFFLLPPLFLIAYRFLNFYSSPFVSSRFSLAVYLFVLLAFLPDFSFRNKKAVRIAGIILFCLILSVNLFLMLKSCPFLPFFDRSLFLVSLIFSFLAVPEILVLSLSRFLWKKEFLFPMFFSSPLFLILTNSGLMSTLPAAWLSFALLFLPPLISLPISLFSRRKREENAEKKNEKNAD